MEISATALVPARQLAEAAAAPPPVYNNLISELKVIWDDRVRLNTQGAGGG